MSAADVSCIAPGACVALAIAVGALGACASAAYPAPPPRALPNTTAGATSQALDDGDPARLAMLERECRTKLSGATAEASLSALDRVHEVLGASCEITTVSHDPLHWLLRCRSDALFASGSYQIKASETACRELGGKKSAPLVCLGAVLRTLLSREQGSALEELGVAVVGHVDMQALRDSSDAHVCSELMKELDYQPTVPWAPVATDASDSERRYANQQLAFCRAASVTLALRQGMSAALAASSAADAPQAREQHVDVAVLGVGDSWLASQVSGSCPSTRKRTSDEHACPDARRVDLLLRFTPRLQTNASRCSLEGDDVATRLACLEQCYDAAAIDDRSARREPSAPLFAPGAEDAAALPPGFYLKQQLSTPDLHLELGRVCSTLGIDATHCPTR